MAGYDNDDDEVFKRIYGDGYKPQSQEEKEREEQERREWEKQRREKDREEREKEREERDRERERRRKENELLRPWDARSRMADRRRGREDGACHSCGEKGHFAQDCPQKDQGGRGDRAAPFRMIVDDRRFRARLIGSGGAVVQAMEKDSGCRIHFDTNTAPGAVEGSFVVRVVGPDKEAVEKGEKLIKDKLKLLEEEFKDRPLKPRQVEQAPAGIPGLAPIPGQPQQQYVVVDPAAVPGGQLVAHWDGTQYVYTVLATEVGQEYGEEKGMEDMETDEGKEARARAAAASVGRGGSERGSGKDEDGPAVDSELLSSAGDVDSSKIPGSLEELERLSMQETAAVTAAQTQVEEKERKRHKERMAEISAAFEKRVADLKQRQAERRAAFFQLQKLMGKNVPSEEEEGKPAKPPSSTPTRVSKFSKPIVQPPPKLAPLPGGPQVSPRPPVAISYAVDPTTGLPVGAVPLPADGAQLVYSYAPGAAMPVAYSAAPPYGAVVHGADGAPSYVAQYAPDQQWVVAADPNQQYVYAEAPPDYNANLALPPAYKAK